MNLFIWASTPIHLLSLRNGYIYRHTIKQSGFATFAIVRCMTLRALRICFRRPGTKPWRSFSHHSVKIGVKSFWHYFGIILQSIQFLEPPSKMDSLGGKEQILRMLIVCLHPGPIFDLPMFNFHCIRFCQMHVLHLGVDLLVAGNILYAVLHDYTIWGLG